MYLLNELIKATEKGETDRRFLTKMIYIQHIDTTYDSVNFDDPVSTLSYYKKLNPFCNYISDEDLDKFFEKSLFYLRKPTAMEKALAHQVMRSTAEKVHVAFRELDRGSHWKTGLVVTIATAEAILSFCELRDENRDSETLLAK